MIDFDSVCIELLPKIKAAYNRKISNSAIVEELTQDAIARIYAYKSTWGITHVKFNDESHESNIFYALAWTIVNKRFLNWAKRTKFKEAGIDISNFYKLTAPNFESALLKRDSIIALNRATAKIHISERDRNIFNFHAQGISQAAIARKLKLTKQNVETSLETTYKKLRGYLKIKWPK
jgi:RNA polymerase sigma factor (sigma-70 family)